GSLIKRGLTILRKLLFSVVAQVNGNDVPAYTERFQELTLICTKFVANETVKIDKYVSELPDNIYGSVKASKPNTLDETIELANELMDQKLRTYAERQTTTKARLMIHSETTMKNNRENPKGNGCFECGAPRHFKRDYPKFKNKDGGNVNAQRWVYAVGNANKKGNASRDPDSNVVTDTFLLNNRYASILFDTGANYIDCLRRCHAVIVCDEKLVRVPYENETLVFHDNESNNEREYRLTVISCSKAQEYMAKGCQIFLAQISAKKEEDKSEGKQLRDVPIIRDFPKVFLEDLPGLPPARPIEFQIDLIPGAAPAARAPYRLAASKMKEFQDESIKDWASPKTPTEIRQFLGLVGYYRRFIEGFLKIAKSMTNLTQKGIKFDWGEKEENSFQLIKQELCSAPILDLPKGSEYFVVYYDASHKGLGDVLIMWNVNKNVMESLKTNASKFAVLQEDYDQVFPLIISPMKQFEAEKFFKAFKQGGKVNAPGWVYAVGNAEKRRNASRDPDSNVVTGTFLLNSRYASILFDTPANRSFVSTAFSSLIDIVPTPLGNSYEVELADGKIVRVDTIMRGCTLNFLNHPFNIDLMPVELGSFEVIIGMDWLRRCHAMILCDEKLVRIPYGNETLTFRGNKSNNEREPRLTVISCSKAQEYMAKGCQIFLAQISAKKEEDRSEGKQLDDVTVVRDFPEVFPKDLSGLPPARPVKFQIDLISGAAPVARAPYRLAPSKMKELSEQLQELSEKDFIRPSSSPWEPQS
nr:putative reverse transcriptase domain-containing protein [Tanacetum cinerariifolium]